MCATCGHGVCYDNVCSGCNSYCSDCVNCVPGKITIVRPVRKNDGCETIIDAVKALIKPEIGDCTGLSLSGTANGNVVILISNDSTVVFSANGSNYQESNVFLNQPSGNNTYFVKNTAGCVRSTTVVVNADCTPSWRPQTPSVTTCINGKVNVLYIDGCGSEEWRATSTNCVDPNTYCSKVLNILPEVVECMQGGITKVILSVSGSDGNNVEFFDPSSSQWVLGNLSVSSHVINFPSNGASYAYKVRLEGCQVQYSGYFNVCQPTMNEFSYTRSEVFPCPAGCAQQTILFSKVYYGATQVQAQENALNDSLFALEAALYAEQNCNCGVFNVNIGAISCSTLPPTPVPVPTSGGNTLFYQIRRCSDNSLFYTITIGSNGQAVEDLAQVRYVYTGNATSLPSGTPPAGYIGTVSHLGVTGCETYNGCSISPVSIVAGNSVVIQNEMNIPLPFCYQPSGSGSVVSVNIPANSSQVTICVNGSNYQDPSGLLTIAVTGSCS